MKRVYFVLSAALLQSTLALASTPPELVEALDNAREGDLATKVAAFYDQNSQDAKCTFNETKRTVAYRISSASSHDEKIPGTKTSYQADYLVLTFCFSGSTFVGAYREATGAAVVSANRHGPEGAKGAIVPSEPDKIQIIKRVDLSAIQSGKISSAQD